MLLLPTYENELSSSHYLVSLESSCSELAIAYGGSADVGFVVPEQQTVPPFPKVIDGSSLRGVE